MRLRRARYPEVALAALALAALLPIGARADLPATEWHAGFEAQTSIPLGYGVRLWGEGPLRLRLEVSADYVPSDYYTLQRSTRIGRPSGPPGAEGFVQDTLTNSWALAVHVGWRPLPRAGLIVAFGYRYDGAVHGDSPYPQQYLAGAAGVAPPDSEWAGASYRLRSAVHLLEGEVGWQWLVWDERITLRATIGLSGVVGSTQQVQPLFGPLNATAVAEFQRQVEGALRRSHAGLAMPYVGLAIGYNIPGVGRTRTPEALPSSWDCKPSSPGFQNE